jgi:lysophospholipase L1-like esterase
VGGSGGSPQGRRARAILAVLVFLVFLLCSGTLEAQTRYLAFGDSITLGTGDDPDREELGYPPRLENRLEGAGRNAEVENHGLGGERTPEGVTRIDSVLAAGGDVLLLMEGSNDISRNISIETTHFNLNTMALKAELRGLSVVHATVIPRIPRARVDPDNLLNQALNERIRHMAGIRGRDLADNFEVFGGISNLFSELYWDDPEDFVGHPNEDGYDEMAEVFFDVLTGADRVPPVTGIQFPRNGQRNVAATAVIEVDVWDFGAGVNAAATTLLVNGSNAGVTPTVEGRRALLRYAPAAPLQGVVTVGLRSADLASPANTVDKQISRFVIAGTEFLDGDLDEDGRVDGSDLVRFARGFGSRRGDGIYDADADFNSDNSIDGQDLAVLASNFGRASF